MRGWMVASYILENQVIPSLRNFGNPFKVKKKARGMGYLTDVIDWLGGYPYEFAKPDEIIAFCERSLGMRCRKTRIKGGLSNNEFVFEAPASSSDGATLP
ncbi:MAG: hypothetical protein HYY96_06835 [Candidatus Tectomicrobia bacterium]|nr:hypothetical protein [Candidatus Tectomicrobia bacterium]